MPASQLRRTILLSNKNLESSFTTFLEVSKKKQPLLLIFHLSSTQHVPVSHYMLFTPFCPTFKPLNSVPIQDSSQLPVTN